jgi:hypothetical protein
MLAYTREFLIDKLIELGGHQKEFNRTGQIDTLEIWLAGLEEDLGRLRHSLSPRTANAQSELRAIWDGFRKEGIDDSIPLRKARRIAVSLTLVEFSEMLSEEVMNIDQKFEVMSDKLAQLLAAASALSPLPGPNGDMALWKQEVWVDLGKHEATQGMYTYLTSSLARADRDHLLDAMLSRLAANGAVINGENE